MVAITIQWLLFSILFLILNIFIINPAGLFLSGVLTLTYLFYCHPLLIHEKFISFHGLVNTISIIGLSMGAIPYIYYFSGVYNHFDIGTVPVIGDTARRVAEAYLGNVPTSGVRYVAAQVYGGAYIINTIFVAISFPIFAHSLKYRLMFDRNTSDLFDLFGKYKVLFTLIFLLVITNLRLFSVGKNSENSMDFFDIVTLGSLCTGPAIYAMFLINITLLYLSIIAIRARHD